MAKHKSASTAAIRKGPPLELPDGDSQDISPGNLLLDPQNLRLFEATAPEIQATPAKLLGQQSIQSKVADLMIDDPRFEIERLASSIIYNGFLKHEHLIVARYDANAFLVLEGNRRLTAIKLLFRRYKDKINELRPAVWQSMQTLPCFVLKGRGIGNSETELERYRRASEIYIGMRHLMGAKSWDPASRYEFQARLIFREGWTPEQVAEHFGRDKGLLQRELKAQKLYQEFTQFEKRRNVSHSLTYNAFAEAARAPSIMKWLGWSDRHMEITNRLEKEAFFHYLLSRLKSVRRGLFDEGEEKTADESAEAAVRRLRDMLKLQDEDINGALLDGAFQDAEAMYELRKEGDFAKRVNSFLRSLKRVTVTEVRRNLTHNRQVVTELIDAALVLLQLMKR